MTEELIRLTCNVCGKAVSSPVPKDTVVRAWLECPECIEKKPTPPTEQWRERFDKQDCSCNYESTMSGEIGGGVICTYHHLEALAQERQRVIELVEKSFKNDAVRNAPPSGEYETGYDHGFDECKKLALSELKKDILARLEKEL